MLITTEGIIIRMSVDDISIIGRNTSGVKLMSIDVDSDIKVASIAKVRRALPRTAIYTMKNILRKSRRKKNQKENRRMSRRVPMIKRTEK